LKQNALVEDCVDWYHQTTYYYEDGSSYTTPWEYQDTICTYYDDGSSSPGASAPPNSPPALPPPPPPCPASTCTPMVEEVKTNNLPPPTDPGDGGVPPPPSSTPCTVKKCETITNNVSDPCLHKMVDAAINSDVQYKLNQSMNLIFGSNTIFNINFIDNVSSQLTDPTESAETNVTNSQTTPIKDANGNTIRTIINSMDIEIVLNKSLLSNISKEYVTATIIHEAFHAYLRKSQTILDQHQEMFQNYFDTMKEQLMQIYPTLSSPDANALVWGGLETDNPTAFNDLGTFGKNAVIITNEKYQTGQFGTPCI